MAELSGFLPPRTPSGRSAIVPDMPWHYSGTLLTAEYRTDPELVAALLPDGAEPAPDDPGAVALIWADWQSCGVDGAELLDPVRAQYLETFAVIRCSYRGEVYSRCVAIWVTTDFAMARGWFQGYPKKLGRIAVTRVMNVGRAAPRLEAGARIGASLAASDHRLASLVVTLRDPSESNGFVNGHAMLHDRRMPSLTRGAPASLDQLVTMGGVDAEIGATWTGDADLQLFDSPWDELASLLPVREPIGAYYREIGVTFQGGRLLRDTSHPEG